MLKQMQGKTIAPSGNRTRAARVAGEHSTTEPTVLDGFAVQFLYVQMNKEIRKELTSLARCLHPKLMNETVLEYSCSACASLSIILL